jgi:hypothetical protein
MQRWVTSLLIAMLLAVPSVASNESAGEFVLSQKVTLNKDLNGVDGWLQVMIDARLSEKVRKEMWGVGGWAFVMPEDDPQYKMFSATPPQNAELQIVDSQGHVLASEILERPLAEIKQARLQVDRPTFLVTVDYSIGMGSYAGLTTLVLDVANAKLRWLEAVNGRTGKSSPIRLPKTLKSDWMLKSRGAQKDILQVLCRPDDFGGSGAFSVAYIRYHFDEGAGWKMRERVKKGIWESDEPFPEAPQFRQ